MEEVHHDVVLVHKDGHALVLVVDEAGKLHHALCRHDDAVDDAVVLYLRLCKRKTVAVGRDAFNLVFLYREAAPAKGGSCLVGCDIEDYLVDEVFEGFFHHDERFFLCDLFENGIIVGVEAVDFDFAVEIFDGEPVFGGGVELDSLLFYLFCVIGKELAGHHAFALNQDFGVDFLFDGELEIRRKQSESVPFRNEFDSVENWIAAFYWKSFCDFLQSVRQLVSLANDFHNPRLLFLVLIFNNNNINKPC